MATNKHFDILILRELLDDLTTTEKGELTAWLNEHPIHLDRYEKLRKTWLDDQLIHDWKAIDIDENWAQILEKADLEKADLEKADLEKADLEKADLEKANQPRRKPFKIFHFVRYAAAAVLLVFVSVWLLSPSSTTIVNESNLPQAHDLPDGSSIWLKHNAAVTFNKKDFTKYRALSMSGEVYFEVAKGEVPFVVTANQSRVQVLGTSFNIQEEEHETEVMLIEGSVMFSSGQISEVLSPGEQAVFDGTEIKKSTDIDMNEIGWKTGVFKFSEQPLHYVLEQISDHYGITYDLKPDVENLMVSTTLDKLALYEVIENLSYILDIQFELQDQHLSIP